MTDQRRAYTLKCLCGFTRKNHIGRPPKVCPQCGAKPEPDGLNRAMRRKLAREMRKSKGLRTTSPDLEPSTPLVLPEGAEVDLVALAQGEFKPFPIMPQKARIERTMDGGVAYGESFYPKPEDAA